VCVCGGGGGGGGEVGRQEAEESKQRLNNV